MSTPDSREENKPPEWHLFDRLDDLESITLELMDKVGTTEPTLENVRSIAVDAYLLAIICFNIAFQRIAEEAMPTIRSTINEASSSMIELGISESTVKRLLGIMTDICDRVENNSKA